MSAEGWASTHHLLVGLRRILKRPEVLPISSGSQEHNRHGTYSSLTMKSEKASTREDQAAVLMSKHRCFAGSLSEKRQQEGKKK